LKDPQDVGLLDGVYWYWSNGGKRIGRQRIDPLIPVLGILGRRNDLLLMNNPSRLAEGRDRLRSILAGITPSPSHRTFCGGLLPSFCQGHGLDATEADVGLLALHDGPKEPGPGALCPQAEVEPVTVIVVAGLGQGLDLSNAELWHINLPYFLPYCGARLDDMM
jgi:hypothetical protein